MNYMKTLLTAASFAAVLGAPTAHAELLTFAAHWSGAPWGSKAVADATVQLDPSLFDGPLHFLGPANPLWGNFTITIKDAAAGNGTFTRSASSSYFYVWTGARLDYTKEMIGQSNGDGCTFGGVENPLLVTADFGFYLEYSGAPEPIYYFQITPYGTPNGLNEPLVLTSLKLIQPVPEPGTYTMILGGLGLIGLASRRKRSAA